jgi:hypothetical protein
MAGAWNAHQRPVRQRNTHGLALTSVAIAGWNEATIDAGRGDPIAAVGAGAVAEGKRRNHEVALGDVSHLRANGLDYANEFVADRTWLERGLPSVIQRSDPHTHARTTRTTASVGWRITASGRSATSMERGPRKTAARMTITPVRVAAA